MGPKKKKGGGSSTIAGKGRGGGTRGAAQVQLSADNERRLRRLLQNTSTTAGTTISSSNNNNNNGTSQTDTPSLPPRHHTSQEPLSELQKKQAAKRLLNIYEKLASEGFSNQQIELGLSAVPVVEATLDTVLDWLCFNLPGDELPKKYSSGCPSVEMEGASVQLLNTARADYIPSIASHEALRRDQDHEDIAKHQKLQEGGAEQQDKTQQKDWIRHYMATLEEEEGESGSHSSSDENSDWEIHEDKKKNRKSSHAVLNAAVRAESIAAEFHAAKLAAAEAKQKGDKQKHVSFGKIIRDLKQEMTSLGLTEEILGTSSGPCKSSEDLSTTEAGGIGMTVTSAKDVEYFVPVAQNSCNLRSSTGDIDKKMEEENKLDEEGDIVDLFDEESAQAHELPVSVMDLQKKEKAATWAMKDTMSEKKHLPLKKKATKTSSKEEMRRQPKAVLQQQCQKNGWEVPKYARVSEVPGVYAYNVSILQPASGRGKTKNVGGLITYCLPAMYSGYKSVEEAQNAVATWALFQLFPQLPLYHILSEPYRAMMLDWHMQGANEKTDADVERARRATFVESLLQTLEQHTESITNTIPSAVSFGDRGNSSDTYSVNSEALTSQAVESEPSSQANDECASLLRKFEEKTKRKSYKAKLESRAALPISGVKSWLLEQIHDNTVVVISGETGSGKTTQVPQYILEEMISCNKGGFCNIVCTQPRRLAAISIAQRVAVEQDDGPPGSRGSLVGYQVRLDSALHHGTKLLFCTTGILLRRLAGDRDLNGVSHLIVDEVHERSMLGDFTLVILKDLIERRRANNQAPLKIILMSATMDAAAFCQYFGNCPLVTVKGRTFPVDTLYLEDAYEILDYRLAPDSPAAITSLDRQFTKGAKNLVSNSRGRRNLVASGWGDEAMLEEEAYNPMFDERLYSGYSDRTKKNLLRLNEDAIDFDLLEDLIVHIDRNGENGAILVFLPGLADIHSLLDQLSASEHFRGVASEWLLPLHSSMSVTEQQKVFQSPPSGVRKVVVATNIAETSITIEDVVHVIDSGKHKEIQYDPNRGMSRMVETWISQANAKQRRGRAGRIRHGHCYCLYTKQCYERMRPFQIPEILRVPLVELCLQVKFLRLGNVASFLDKAMDCPKTEAINSAIATLHEVGALDKEEELTALGYHLARLPVDVWIGKMMLYGSILGCLSPILTIAACLSYKSPFSPSREQMDAVERAKKAYAISKGSSGKQSSLASGQQSDQLAMVAAYNGWMTALKKRGSRAAYDYCKSNFLSAPTLNMLRDMRSQFAVLLADIGFISLSEGSTAKEPGGDYWIDDLNRPYNYNSHLASIIKATICAGLYPNIAKMDDESIRAGHASLFSRRAGLASSGKVCWWDGRQEVFLHPSSVNHNVTEFRYPFLVYHEKVKTSKIYIRDTTIISPYTLLLFGGTINVQHQTGQVLVDEWLKMDAPAQTAVLFKELRIALDGVLQEIMKNPQGTVVGPTKEVVLSIVNLLLDEENTKF